MGMVTIQIAGSFKQPAAQSFSAMEGGHALALSRAIHFLIGQLPAAIEQDHALHDEGTRPPGSDFGVLPEKKPR